MKRQFKRTFFVKLAILSGGRVSFDPLPLSEAAIKRQVKGFFVKLAILSGGRHSDADDGRSC